MFGKRKPVCEFEPTAHLRPRPCEVDGQVCTFHRFIDEDKALLRINCFTRPDERDAMVRYFRQAGAYAATECSTEIIRVTLALVEYPDGSIGKVDPEKVTFLDTKVQSLL